MNKTIEIEFKFQVLDRDQIDNFLSNLRFIDKKRTVDVYLDTKDGDLYKKGIFIRIRDNKNLEFKFNLEDFKNLEMISNHDHCDEYSFPLPLTNRSLDAINQICNILGLRVIKPPTLKEFKTLNNFVELMIISKIRKKYEDEKFEYSLDDVKGLGLFLEIEARTSNGDDLEKIKDKMRENIRNLRLKLITTGYGELYWREHNFDLYKQGRYFLEEDRD